VVNYLKAGRQVQFFNNESKVNNDIFYKIYLFLFLTDFSCD